MKGPHSLCCGHVAECGSIIRWRCPTFADSSHSSVDSAREQSVHNHSLRIHSIGGEPMRLSTAIKNFDTQLRADGSSDRTRQAYLRDLGKLLCWLKRDGEVSIVTPNTLWLDSSPNRGLVWNRCREPFPPEPHECFPTLTEGRSPAMSKYIWIGPDVHMERAGRDVCIRRWHRRIRFYGKLQLQRW